MQSAGPAIFLDDHGRIGWEQLFIAASCSLKVSMIIEDGAAAIAAVQ